MKNRNMKKWNEKKWNVGKCVHQGSYTVEAAIYIPMIVFLLFQTVDIAIDCWQESKEREVCEKLQGIDAIQEFYFYQILDEARKEIIDD